MSGGGGGTLNVKGHHPWRGLVKTAVGEFTESIS